MNLDHAWIGNENYLETKHSGTKIPGTKILCRVGGDRLHLSTSLHRLDEFVCRRSNRHTCLIDIFRCQCHALGSGAVTPELRQILEKK